MPVSLPDGLIDPVSTFIDPESISFIRQIHYPTFSVLEPMLSDKREFSVITYKLTLQ